MNATVEPEGIWRLAVELGERLSLGKPFAEMEALRILMDETNRREVERAITDYRMAFIVEEERLKGQIADFCRRKEAAHKAMVERMIASVFARRAVLTDRGQP